MSENGCIVLLTLCPRCCCQRPSPCAFGCHVWIPWSPCFSKICSWSLSLCVCGCVGHIWCPRPPTFMKIWQKCCLVWWEKGKEGKREEIHSERKKKLKLGRYLMNPIIMTTRLPVKRCVFLIVGDQVIYQEISLFLFICTGWNKNCVKRTPGGRDAPTLCLIMCHVSWPSWSSWPSWPS